MTPSAVLEAPPSTAPVRLDHLSWSGIKTYQTCPRKFAFRYLEQVPEEFKASSLLFGSAFHTTVERVQEARLQGLDVPGVDELMAIFDDAWQRESIGSEIQFCKEEDEGTARQLAQRMLSAYVEYASLEMTLPGPAQIISVEHSNRFRLLADVPPIESRIDLLELQGTNLVVSDLKSSRSRWNDAKVQESIPQLVLYATGLLPLMRELGAKRIVTKFVVVSETWSAVQTGLFVKRESWACGQCPYRGRCLGR